MELPEHLLVVYQVLDSAVHRQAGVKELHQNAELNRPIDCVSYVEIRNAVFDAIRINGSLHSDNAALAVSRVLGFNRTGAKINDTIGAVIRMEIEAVRIKDSNGRLVL